MDGFDKIDLSASSKQITKDNDGVASDTVSQMNRRQRRIRFPKKTLLIFLAVLAIITGAAFFAVVLPAQNVYGSAMTTKLQAQKAWDAIKKQNVELASTELEKTKKSLQETQKKLDSFSYLGVIPFVNNYYNDAQHLSKAGGYGVDATILVVDSVKPYADVLGLKGKGSFVMGSAEDRVRLAVTTMGKITPRIDDVSKLLVQAKKEVDEVDPSHYPVFLGLSKIQNQLVSIKSLADQGVSFVDQARPLIKLLPSLAGETKEKKYLVLFQNDKELRPTGGFLTAYAVFRVDKGVIHVDRSDDMYTLDNTISRKPSPPDPIKKYLPLVTQFNLRDTNLSPDYVNSMKTFLSLYDTASGKTDVDGIIALDTHVLVSTIKILDDQVQAGGTTFTTKTDKRCDCPQVIFELERITDTPKSLDLRVSNLYAVQAQRKDILGILLYAVMQKALKSSPKLYWGPLIQSLIADTNEKHVLFYIFDKDAQSGIEALNAAGRIQPSEGNYLHINEANFGGAKSNLYVKESVLQEIESQGDASLVQTITISYKNPFPPSDCNLERGGLCLNAILRNWVRFYVPKGSTLLDSKGSEVTVTSYDELGKTVFEGFLTVRPQGSATYMLKYKLPFKVAKGSPLPYLIQKQPGTDSVEYTVKVDGKTVEKFPLLTDKELKLRF